MYVSVVRGYKLSTGLEVERKIQFSWGYAQLSNVFLIKTKATERGIW